MQAVLALLCPVHAKHSLYNASYHHAQIKASQTHPTAHHSTPSPRPPNPFLSVIYCSEWYHHSGSKPNSQSAGKASFPFKLHSKSTAQSSHSHPGLSHTLLACHPQLVSLPPPVSLQSLSTPPAKRAWKPTNQILPHPRSEPIVASILLREISAPHLSYQAPQGRAPPLSHFALSPSRPPSQGLCTCCLPRGLP